MDKDAKFMVVTNYNRMHVMFIRFLLDKSFMLISNNVILLYLHENFDFPPNSQFVCM